MTALKRVRGFARLSVRIDCAIPNLVTYAAGIVEVPEGVASSVQRVLASDDTK